MASNDSTLRDTFLARYDNGEFSDWIEKGIPHAQKGKKETETGPDFEKLTQTHWSLQPVGNPKPPETKNIAWPKTDIDRFILAGLEKEAERPA